MNKIGASILGAKNKVDTINKLIEHNITQIHYDVMDGKFVPNTSISSNEVLDIIGKTKKHITDVHLMTVDPIQQIDILDGKVEYITFHIEVESDISQVIKNRKSKIGISINPSTSVESIAKYVTKVNHVLVMSVEPGKGGQTFIKNTLNKIKQLKQLNKNLIVQVDGGINEITGPKCFAVGANSLVAGSFIMNNINDVNIKDKLT